MAEGFYDFTPGQVLTAAQVDDYLMRQAVMRFADSAARTTALSGVLVEGMMSYLKDTNAVEVYDGSAWVGVGGVKYGAATGADKTSIMCWIKDEVGALYGVLLPFKEQGINLTKIESFPSRRRPWEYLFFVDFEGHADDAPVARALAAVGTICKELKILGSFPRSPAPCD